MDMQNTPHRRYNPLLDEWVKVSPHRTARPWNGQVEKPQVSDLKQYDENCYLCPGNTRAGGRVNPEYTEPFVFDNDYSALLPDVEHFSQQQGPDDMLKAESERGICRVACFSPRHDLTLSRMDQRSIEQVIEMWRDEYNQLGSLDYINHVQIFENRGEVMGCSNPHPHCQIWAEQQIPTIPEKEIEMQGQYYRKHDRPLLLDYLAYELEQGEHIVADDTYFTALVPYWAVWPFETMILPKQQITSLSEISTDQISSLASLMRTLGIKMDNLFATSFPYSMGIHQAPTDGKSYPGLQMHIHYYPPLLRSATVRKFMVGYELMAMPQRDLSAETSAQRLRDQSNVHYLERM